MPQDDLETLVIACANIANTNNRKITCETLSTNIDNPSKNVAMPNEDHEALPPDFPPESFWLSKDAEIDWFDRNVFYERKESTKGVNSNSNNNNNGPHINPSSSNSNSQRFSINLKSKASIIGLPKSQKATFADSKRRTCKPGASVRLFPKRSGSIGKSMCGVVEPGSPKVSCMGRVKSKRGRRRSSSIRRSEKPEEKSSEKKRTGLYSKVMSMFRSKKGHKKTSSRSGSRKVVEVMIDNEPVVILPNRSMSVKVREIPINDEPVPEPPGLGGMKRFASGRQTGSWTSEDFNRTV